MNDQAIEQEIRAKGLNAPRVTLADLNANIVDTEIVKARVEDALSAALGYRYNAERFRGRREAIGLGVS